MEAHEFERSADANLIAFWAAYGKAPGRTYEQQDGLCWFYTGVPYPLFNGVLEVPRDEALIAETHARLAELVAKHAAPALWWLGPGAQRTNVGKTLETLGLKPSALLPCMSLELASLEQGQAPANFAIELVEGEGMRREWARVAAAGTGLSDAAAAAMIELEASLGAGAGRLQPRYLGRLDGEPVATSALVCEAGLAGVYAVATLGHARNRGIGRMMTARPLMDARKLGFSIGVLQASPMGRPIYEAMGFREAYAYGTFVQA